MGEGCRRPTLARDCDTRSPWVTTSAVRNAMAARAPETLRTLTKRYDPQVFELGRQRARIRLVGAGPAEFDVLLDGHRARLVPGHGGRPAALREAVENA